MGAKADMSKVDWCQILSWGEDELDDLRLTGYAYLKQGKYDIALSFFEALVVLSPENSYDLQTLGALYLQLDMPQKAHDMLEKALKYEGDHSATLLNLSKTLFMLKKNKEGLRLAEILQNDHSSYVSNVAKAIVLAHSITQ
jgi:tetratricopeptide (TPR) repeat protein